ncbi:aromatic acid exporter family protein [Microbacterium kribbense]|uniref:Aromatic acid exporter family protein n=1 Tax=Microbacterium kribbense TaxID=433645 RepID=A0ABP7GMN4_9MICO
MRMIAAFRASRRAPLLQVLKSAVATVAAWLLSAWLIPGPLPVFAAIAALLVVQPSLNQSFAKAIERTVGVIIGVAVAGVLDTLLGSGTWIIMLAIVVALLLAWSLRMTAGTANQVAISAMLVLALGTGTPGYAVDRIIETMIGAVIGFIVNILIVPPTAIAPAHARLEQLGTELAGSLDRLAGALQRPQTAQSLTELIVTARLLRPMRDAAESAIVTATESLTLNPRAGGHRAELAELRRVLDLLSTIVTQTIGMTRAVHDRWDPSLPDESTVTAIAEQLRRAAHDIRLMIHRADAAAAVPDEGDEPALTRPLMVGAPRSGHWVLVGSLLVDLHRIHLTLTEDA